MRLTQRQNDIKEPLTNSVQQISVLKSIILSFASLFPGVNISTFATTLCIYRDLLEGIALLNLNFLKNLITFKFNQCFQDKRVRFLGLTAILLFVFNLFASKPLNILLVKYTLYVNSCIFGIVLATAIIAFLEIRKWGFLNIILILLTIGFSYLTQAVNPTNTGDSLVLIFLCGIIAAIGFVLPGISGSVLLLLLGKYYYILDAQQNNNYVILAIYLISFIIGIIAMVKLIVFFFNKFNSQMHSILAGLIIGSLYKSWPWQYAKNAIISDGGKIIPLQVRCYMPFDLKSETFSAILLIVFSFLTPLIFILQSKEPCPNKK